MCGSSLRGCNLCRWISAFAMQQQVNLIEMVVRLVCFLFDSLKVANEKDIYQENVSLIRSEGTASVAFVAKHSSSKSLSRVSHLRDGSLAAFVRNFGHRGG